MAALAAELSDDDIPGNYLARRMKALQERSSSVFAGKDGSATHEFDRFATEYGQEFYHRDLFEKPVSAAVIRRMQEDGKGRKPFSAPSSQRFNLWKIPAKLVDEETFTKIQRRKTSLTEEKTTPRFPHIVQPTSQSYESYSPSYEKLNSKPALKFPEPHALSPLVGGGGGGGAGTHAVPPGQPPSDGARDPQLWLDADANGDLTEMEKESLTFGVQQHQLPAALEYVRKAPKSDRYIIAQALRYGATHSGSNEQQEPNQLKAVEQWLQAANEEEREVARRFFNSILAAELSGGANDCGDSAAGAVQRAKLTALLDRLDRERSTRPWPLRPEAAKAPDTTASADVLLKHLRLLSPETRATKWQHQSWHHLPLYKNKVKADNVSSHYVRVHKPVSLHFTIHPDWGE